MTKFRVLDLFSGIGGFSLGLERTGGFETVAFCEINEFCRRVLAHHWPKVRRYEDVRTLSADVLRREGIRPNAICGGFPCQDISTGGQGEGIHGSRSGLFFDIIRLARELRPELIILENVAALLSRGMDVVLGALASIGYDAEWHCVPATALGYPHERDRIWIVAYPAALRRGEGCGSPEGWGRFLRPRLHGRPSAWAQAANDDEVRSQFLRLVDGLPNHVDQLAAYGNAVVPEVPEMIGRAVLEARAA
ncbi:DNA (cytosine-5-)-methyltransferase [Sinorhizobium medicae]|nr:DNA (cytosine-5-)-methyltransferase [Sinorhizobium medicae]